MIGPLEFNGVVQRAQDISIIKQNEDIKPQYEHMNVQNQQQQKSIIKHENVNKKIMLMQKRINSMLKKRAMEHIIEDSIIKRKKKMKMVLL